MKRKILVADLLCGAGGSSTGAGRALAELGLEMELVCVNHWPVAIDTHQRNHPEARHYVQDISTVRPHILVPEGYLDLLMASPTCTHHSVARGGKPTSDQQRSDPWHIITWLTDPPARLNENYSPTERAAYAAMDRDQRLAFMWQSLDGGAALFSACWNAPVPRICVENPVMHRHARERIKGWQKPQTVQPWWFGEPAFKATGLYLRGLPPLIPTDKLVPPKAGTDEHKAWSKVHRASPGPDRWKDRSRTYEAVAAAMAAQWNPGVPLFMEAAE